MFNLLIGMAVGAAATLALLMFFIWFAVGIGRIWGGISAKKTGVRWGYVDREVARILAITEPTRQRTEFRELLHEVANQAAKFR